MTFARTFLDLAAKLNVDNGTGKTFLDDSLVVWTQEPGEYPAPRRPFVRLALATRGAYTRHS